MISLFAMENKLLKEIFFLQKILSSLVRIPCKDCIVFSWKLLYFFFVPRVVCKSTSVGFIQRSPLHILEQNF